MNLHSLTRRDGAVKRRKRVGRGMGSGVGKTSGRGHKGQMSRKGSQHKPGFEGGQMRLVRRIPKRGFKNPVGKTFLTVNIGRLSRFEDGTAVTQELLKKSGLAKGNADGIKILGQGDLDKKLTVSVSAFSATARAKIEAAGGVCETV